MTAVYDVISPHLDDAALSCSHFLAAHPGSCVTTVFAGGPLAVRPLTSWDRATGYFPEGADVAGVRRGEDMSATAMVKASAVHLRYWDRQYRSQMYGYEDVPDDRLPSAIAEELRQISRTGRAWVMPLGLGHPDHWITAEAGLILALGGSDEVYLYEDLPYAVEDPLEVARRKESLASRGFSLEPGPPISGHDPALKAAAIGCHASQRRTLRRRARVALRAEERIWRLVPL